MNLNKKQILIWVLAAVPVAIVAAVYGRLPDMVPKHWGFDGTVTYGPKATILWLAFMSPLMALLFPLLRRIDPRRKNYEKFGRYYLDFQLIMIIFLTLTTLLVISESLNPGTLDVERIVLGGVGLLILAAGNMMPKFKHNFFIGVRTPWTLSSERVWSKTHRIAGKTWVLGGIVMILSTFIKTQILKVVIFTAATIIIGGIPVIASYFIWKNEEEGEDEDAD